MRFLQQVPAQIAFVVLAWCVLTSAIRRHKPAGLSLSFRLAIERASYSELSFSGRHYMLKRRTLLKSAAFTLPLGVSALAQAKPLEGVTRLVVGFPAGTSVDLIARRYAAKLQGTYADTVIVENRPGAAGRMALEQVKRAQPDGRTLILVPSALMTLYPSTYKSLRYDPVKDFIPGGSIYDASLGLAIGPGVPSSVTTLPQFVQWAKAQDKSVFFSANAQGAGPHFMGLQFAKEAGLKMDYVPFQGGAPALNALLGGQIPVLCISMGTLAPQMRNGSLRVLASFDAVRNPLFPEVPTLREFGYQNLVENEWGAFFLPAGASSEHVSRLEASVAQACAQQDIIEAMRQQFLTVNFRDSKATAEYLRRGIERHRQMVQSSNFEPME